MHAVDDLSDAIDATRAFLTPVKWQRWLKLAVIIFFVSSLGLGGPTIPTTDVSMVTEDPTADGDVGDVVAELEAEFGEGIIDELLVIGLVIGAILFAIWLIFAFIAAIMEFVLVQSLRTREVHVRRYTRQNLARGTRLYGFRLGVMALSALLVGGPAAVAVLVWGVGLGDLSAGLAILSALVVLTVGLVYSMVMRFTSEFVVPVMLKEERTVLSAWRRFWGTLTATPREYVVYLILIWLLQFVVSIAAGIVIAISGFIIAIPFVILGVVLALTLGPAGVGLALLFGVFGFLLFLLVASLVWTPIITYFKYYALLLLGDTNPAFDLIPDQRREIRGDGGNKPDNGPKTGVGPTEPSETAPWGESDTDTPTEEADREPDDSPAPADTEETDDDDETRWGGESDWDRR